MKKKRISLIKASQVKPFFHTAEKLGVPVKKMAKKACLPFEEIVKGEGVVGEHAAWDFIFLASQYCNAELLGYYTALDHAVHQTGELGGMELIRADSLKGILEFFIRDVVNESDNCEYQLVSDKQGLWFTRELPWKHQAGWIAEQYVLSFIIQIIRLCAPGDWLPEQMRIATKNTPVELPNEWESISIKWGWHRSELFIEKNILTLPPRFAPTDNILASNDMNQRKMLIEDLIDRQIWNKQTSQKALADELGMSTATLKRLLAKLDTSYSKFLSQRRIAHAEKLMSDSKLTITQIARMLGYSAVSNFSRAFYKSTGYYPSEKR